MARTSMFPLQEQVERLDVIIRQMTAQAQNARMDAEAIATASHTEIAPYAYGQNVGRSTALLEMATYLEQNASDLTEARNALLVLAANEAEAELFPEVARNA